MGYPVGDDDAGFDRAHARIPFTPFQRPRSPRELEGAGIASALTAGIVRRHEAWLPAEESAAPGAQIGFTLEDRGGEASGEEAVS